MTSLTTRGFELHPWQLAAVDAWTNAPSPCAGTLEVFTGGGKTLIALACAAHAAANEPGLRLAVVVPTEALAHQWRASILEHTSLQAHEVGLAGAGAKDTFDRHRALILVLNTAAKKLPELAQRAQPLMLIVDECHRAGAPTFSRVLTTPAAYRLGLSATPEREELDEDGEPLAFDEQLVGRKLGPVVYRFSLRDARAHGWLPDYDLHHHGLTLHPDEKTEYDVASRRVDELADELKALGIDRGRAQQLQGRRDEVGKAAQAYVAATSRRKDLLYRTVERNRVAAHLVRRALEDNPARRILLFHERVAEATRLYETVRATPLEPATDAGEALTLFSEAAPTAVIQARLEHSRLSAAERTKALDDFRTGAASVLVSVKSLIEGIDVPDADVGISVASSASVRQRVQSLGRVLRRQFDTTAPTKHAEMHLLYVADTVDELIYRKEDWSDLTGEGLNHYWKWSLDPAASPEPQDGPPASPRPTEEQEWLRLGEGPPTEPVRWLGDFIGQEYSVDTLGTVTNHWGRIIRNPQDVGQQVESVRRRPGGRFKVTPSHSLVLVMSDDRDEGRLYATGALGEAFEALDEPEPTDSTDVDVTTLAPGDPYPGPINADGGTVQLRKKRGGVIEREAPDGSIEFAQVEGTGRTDLEANASRLLDAWKHALDRGVTVQINNLGHAWFTAGGQRRYLAEVQGGFAWPTAQEETR